MMQPQPAPTVTGADIGKRLMSSWFPLVFVVLFTWLDWISHRDLFAAIILFGGSAVVIFRSEIGARTGLTKVAEQLPPQAKPIFLAIPGLVYYYLRGQGTADPTVANAVILFTMGFVVVVAIFGQKIDARLAGFYESRNRILPRLVRGILAPVLAVLISFAVIHGNLGDLPALFGGTTVAARSPVEVSTLTFVVATLLAAGASFLLLRDRAK